VNPVVANIKRVSAIRERLFLKLYLHYGWSFDAAYAFVYVRETSC